MCEALPIWSRIIFTFSTICDRRDEPWHTTKWIERDLCLLWQYPYNAGSFEWYGQADINFCDRFGYWIPHFWLFGYVHQAVSVCISIKVVTNKINCAGDKVKHRKGLMLAGMFTLFGSLFFFLYGSHFGMFAAARALQGFAEACICTLGMTIISDTFSDDQLGRQVRKTYM